MADIAAFITGELEAAGVAERPAPNYPVQLSDPDHAWVVHRGKLDLFLTVSRDGLPIGARFPIMRIEAPGAAFGVASASGASLVACAAPGTTLIRIPAALLFRRSEDGDQAASELVESWVAGLAAVLGEHKLSRTSPALIEAGDVISLAENAQAVAAKHSVAWVIHRRGASLFLGIESYSIDDSFGLFPLARYCWVEGAPGTEICAAGIAEHRKLDAEWEGFHRFGAMAVEIFAERHRQAQQADGERLRTRAVADNALLHRIMLRLAAPIQKLREVSEEENACPHPVFLACQMIASRAGFRVQPHPDMQRGLELPDPVAAIARVSNIRVRRITLKGKWWKTEIGPVLCFEEQTKCPVAILPGSGGLTIYNPADESIVRLTAAIAERISPSAYVLYRPFPRVRLAARGLLRFAITNCNREFGWIAGSGVAIGLLGLMTPYATGVVFDQLIPGAEKGALAQMCLFLVVAALASAMFSVARGYAVLRLQGRMDAVVQAAVWDRMLSLSTSFFRDYSAGDLAQRSMGVARIREALTGTALTAILSGVFSIFSFALLFYYSWRLALLATGLVGVACAVSVACGLVRLRAQRSMTHLEGKIASTLLQFITGMSKLRVSGTERRAFAAWGRQFAKFKAVSMTARRNSAGLNVFTAVYPLVCTGTFFLCYYAVPSLASGVSTGAFLAFLAAFAQFLGFVLALSTAAVNTLTIIPLYERASPILEAVPEVTEAKTTPGRLTGAIEVSHVTFRYKSDSPPVLRDISLKIKPGEFVAFVGASGSGKSTLLRLLLGFEQPESGVVYFDGQDLAGLDVQAVRRQIGVVLQSGRPVSGSVFENIVGSAPLTIADAWQAAQAAGFDQDIRRMPMGMHTYLSDGGGGISGGQRQRLLIARAIVARPRMLIFDEATSALDNRTQEIVSRSLDGLQATRVVIAHRLSTIINADRIFVLEKGTIVQSGSYSQLITQEGLFKTLAERQAV